MKEQISGSEKKHKRCFSHCPRGGTARVLASKATLFQIVQFAV
jgi:hypothetical protein